MDKPNEETSSMQQNPKVGSDQSGISQLQFSLALTGNRPDITTTMLGIAEILARRSTCQKLAVGCVLVDKKNRILATGYNGVPSGFTHCTVERCPGARAPKGADLCHAVHAEQNALLQCKSVDEIYTCYTTHFPCMRCIKTLLNTPCQSLIVSNMDSYEQPAYDLWRNFRKFFACRPLTD